MDQKDNSNFVTNSVESEYFLNKLIPESWSKPIKITTNDEKLITYIVDNCDFKEISVEYIGEISPGFYSIHMPQLTIIPRINAQNWVESFENLSTMTDYVYINCDINENALMDYAKNRVDGQIYCAEEDNILDENIIII